MSLDPGVGLFSGLFARGPIAKATDDHAVLQAMLTVEVALLRALETCGLAPGQAAAQLRTSINDTEFDLADLGRGTGEQGTPVPALLKILRAAAPEPARSHLHAGATSQDVVDTALMLVARDALDIILADLDRALTACAALAVAHGDTVMVARTLLQDALPTTFALKAATWRHGLSDARAGLADVREHGLAAQLGGAAGTLAAYGERGLDVADAFAAEVGLAAPLLPWHTVRTRTARLACALGIAAGLMGKMARDVVLLAQTEVGECAEGGGSERGGSSTMPHKRNPVGAIGILACAGQTASLLSGVLAALVSEHERAAGPWQSEWEPLLRLLTLTGSAAAASADLLEGLRVDPERMRTNLQSAGAGLMTESLVGALAGQLGRAAATQRVQALAARAHDEGRPLSALLGEDAEIAAALGPDGLQAALDPENYLGVAEALVQRALA